MSEVEERLQVCCQQLGKPEKLVRALRASVSQQKHGSDRAHPCPGLLLPPVAKEQGKVKALHGQLAAPRLPELKESLKMLL